MNAPADVQLLLLGRTGRGRSATGNSILRCNAFKTSSGPSSQTAVIDCQLSEFNSQRIKVVDSPGVGHTFVNKKRSVNLHMSSMEYAIAANPHGYDAFLLVVKYGEKYTTEINDTFEYIRKVFGQDFIKDFCILVVTCGDIFERETKGSGKSIEQWSEEHPGVFRDLVIECEQRVVLFDNTTTDETKRLGQVEQLLQIVGVLRSKGIKYTDEHFAHARGCRQRFIVEDQKALIQEEVMTESSLILKKIENVQSLEDLEMKMDQLHRLQIRAQELSKKIASLDNGTGVLNEIIAFVKSLKRSVAYQTNSSMKMVNGREEKKQEQENIRLIYEDKLRQLTEEYDKRIANEVRISDELKATIKRLEEQTIRLQEKSRDETDKIELHTECEPYKQQICSNTGATESQQANMGCMPDDKLGAASNKNKMADSEQVDLLLIGKIGGGISATGNSILGRKAFKTGSTAWRVTNTVDFEVSEVNGRVIQVVDTPGLYFDEDTTTIMTRMEYAIAANPRGYNAFLLVVNYSHGYTSQDQKAIDNLKMTFGQDFVKRFCILVFTHGDNFEIECEETGISFQEWCNNTGGRLQDLMKECNNRVVLFDNRTPDLAKKNKQMENLLNVVDNLSSKGQRHNYDNFARAKLVREALYNYRLLQSRE